MLSKKAKYAMKALLYLAREYSKGPVLIAVLAEKERIPRKFLELILLELKNHGFVESKKGRGGGYFLAHDPNCLTLGQTIRAVEGPLAPVTCVSQTAYRRCDDCRDERSCGVRLVMKEVRDATAALLDGATLASVIARADALVNDENARRVYYI
jgi:Rrf2 family protein